MNSQTTVALCRSNWSNIIDPSDPNNPQFLQTLNRAIQRLMNSGKWRGAIERMTFKVNRLGNGSEGYIMLPRRFQSLLAATYNKVPRPVFSQWHEFIQNGPGQLDETKPYYGVLIDDGDGWPCQKEIPNATAGYIRIDISVAGDAGKVIRFEGEDQNGEPIYDNTGVGFNLTTAYPTTTLNTQLVTKITAVQKPVFTGYQSAFIVQSGVPTQIARWEPTETIPCYHRYSTGKLPSPIDDDHCIEILAQRRAIQLIAETDFVIPGNLEALGCMLRGTQQSSSLQRNGSAAEWSDAHDILNEEARAQRGGSRPSVNAQDNFSPAFPSLI